MGSKDRLELESKVLAAALKQSHARGDTSGVSLAHKQIFLLLRQQQAADKSDQSGDQTANRVDETPPAEPAKETESAPAAAQFTEDAAPKKARKRVMPDIVWMEDETPSGDAGSSSQDRDAESNGSEVTEEGGQAGTPGGTRGAEPGGTQEAAQEGAHDVVGERPPSNEQGETAQAVSLGNEDLSASQEVAAMDASESGDFDMHNFSPPLGGEEGGKGAFNAYGILQVEQIAGFEEIHRSFLFLVRRVLIGLKKAKKKQRRPLLEQLQNLWIAHDILSDPVTRTDFDFRILGLRGAPDVIIHSAPEDKTDSISSRTPLRIGELMQCAGLLEPTELEIAADMHKAMPEMLFGAFLVKQGFISEEDLGQVLMGQRLLKSGNLSVGHYQMCMKKWRENQTPLEETVVAEGFVTQAEMERIVSSGLRDTAGVPAYQGGAGSIRGSAPRINAEEAAKRNLSVGHAVPQWKDQLDWSEPEAIEEYVAEDRETELLRKPIENNLDIEGVTDGVTKDASKKSLRRLMEGIHSPEQPSIEDGAPPAKSLKSILSLGGDVPMQGQVKVDRLAAPPAEASGEAVSDVASQSPREDAMLAEQAIQAEAAIHGRHDSVPGDATNVPAEIPTASNEVANVQDGTENVRVDASNPAALDVNAPTSDFFSDAAVVVQGFDETTIEELAIPEEAPLTPSTSRPTTDVPVPKIVMENHSSAVSSQVVDEDNVFGEVDYDDEDIPEGELDLGFIPDLPASRLTDQNSVNRAHDGSEFALDSKTAQDGSQGSASSGQPARAQDASPSGDQDKQTTLSMDDLLDFSTPLADSEAAAAAAASSEAEKSDIGKVLNEAFNGPRVTELPPHTPPPEDLVAGRAEAEANFEAIGEEESQMQSGVYPVHNIDLLSDDADASLHSTASSQKPSNEPRDSTPSSEVSNSRETSNSWPSGEASGSASSRDTSELQLSSNIMPNMESTVSVNESSFKAMAEYAKKEQMKQHVGDEGFVIPKGIDEHSAPNSGPSGDIQTMDTESSEALNSIQSPNAESAQSSQTTEEIDVGKVAQTVESADIALSSANQLPTANADDETPQPETVPSESAQAVSPESSEVVSPDSENDEDALKSGEWQIVYKLQGSLADVFLSEESEADMPKMRPRLTEIDSIIPSSITKAAKSHSEDSSKADPSKEDDKDDSSSKNDATKSGGKQVSDKPVIKPVSNNYYRNEKGGKKGEDKGGKKTNE